MAFQVGDIVVHTKYSKGLVINEDTVANEENTPIIEVCFAGTANKWYVKETGEPVSLSAGVIPITPYKPELHLSDKIITLVNQYEYVQSQISSLTNSVAASLKLHTLIEEQWQERFDAQAEELDYLRELLQNGQAELADPIGFAKDVAEFNDLLQQDDGLRTTLSGEPIIIRDELRNHPPKIY